MKILKRFTLLLLIIFNSVLLQAYDLSGKTPEAQLFADALCRGDFYLCRDLLEDPDSNINLGSDFNDLLGNHVFSAYGGFYRDAESPSFYLKKEPFRIINLLLDAGVNLYNINLWEKFPVRSTPEVRSLADRMLSEGADYGFREWFEKSIQSTMEYYKWLSLSDTKISAESHQVENPIISMTLFSNIELTEAIRETNTYAYDCALEEIRKRSIEGLFDCKNQIYNYFLELRSNGNNRDQAEDMKYILFLLEDRRIIPYLLYESLFHYSYNTSEEELYKTRYLIQRLDNKLYDAVYSEKLNRDSLIKLSEILIPYFNGKKSLFTVISETTDEDPHVIDVLTKYASTDESFISEIIKKQSDFETDLRFGEGNVRLKAISLLSLTESGTEFLKEYLFKTWSPAIFDSIASLIDLPDSSENRSRLSEAISKWGKRSYCTDQDLALNYLLNTKIKWGDESYFDDLRNNRIVDFSTFEYSMLAKIFEGDDALEILIQNSPFEGNQYNSYYKDRYFAYTRHNAGNGATIKGDYYITSYFKDFFSEKPDESLNLPFKEEIKDFCSWEYPLRRISAERELTITSTFSTKDVVIQGVILLSSEQELTLSIYDDMGNVMGRILLQNTDSTDCWRSFRIPLGLVDFQKKQKTFFLRNSTYNELIVPEIYLLIKE